MTVLFKRIFIFYSLTVLLAGMFTLNAVHAILPEDSTPINLGAPLYYGGEIENPTQTTGGASCYELTGMTVNDADAFAATIDDYLQQNAPASSPFQGMGDLFISGAQSADINPMFLVTIAQKESSFGTAGVATNGSNNAFGRTATADQPHVETNRRWYKYDSFAASLDGQGSEDQPTYMRRKFIEELNATSIEGVMNVYAPPSENDTEQYIDEMRGRIDEIIESAGESIGCGGAWTWPYGGDVASIGSCFGDRFHPIQRVNKHHNGLDISGSGGGTPILAAANGEVVFADSAGGAGLLVTIDHTDGHGDFQTKYMHNSAIHVQVGQQVVAGEHISNEGTTGGSTGNHLHFEILEGGTGIDPIFELPIPDGVPITGSNCPASVPGVQG